jgi:hypothetical protein
VLCVDCGFDTATADTQEALAALADVEARVAVFVADRRHPSALLATDGPGGPGVAEVLALCAAFQEARRALLGSPRRESGEGTRPHESVIPIYSALAILTTETAWLHRATTSLASRPATAMLPPAIAEAVHDLQHATLGVRPRYSAGETSPLS